MIWVAACLPRRRLARSLVSGGEAAGSGRAHPGLRVLISLLRGGGLRRHVVPLVGVTGGDGWLLLPLDLVELVELLLEFLRPLLGVLDFGHHLGILGHLGIVGVMLQELQVLLQLLLVAGDGLRDGLWVWHHPSLLGWAGLGRRERLLLLPVGWRLLWGVLWRWLVIWLLSLGLLAVVPLGGLLGGWSGLLGRLLSRILAAIPRLLTCILRLLLLLHWWRRLLLIRGLV